MNGLEEGALTIEIDAQEDQPILCIWRGESTDREPGRVLLPFFSQLLVAARKAKTGVEMHFEELRHFNSSTLTAIIQLIQKCRSVKVPLVIVYAPSLRWQRMSFDALRVFVDKEGVFQLRAVAQG